MLGWLWGCDMELREKELNHQYEIEAAKTRGDNWAVEQSIQTQRLQMEYDAAVRQANAQAAAAAQAQQALSEAEIARVNADLEYRLQQLSASVEADRLAASERRDQLAATTNLAIAKIASQTDIALSQDDTPQLLLLVVGLVILAMAGGFGAWQWRRGQEARAVTATVLAQRGLPAPAAPAGYLQQALQDGIVLAPRAPGVSIERSSPGQATLIKMRQLEDMGVPYQWDEGRRLLIIEGAGRGGGRLMLEDKG